MKKRTLLFISSFAVALASVAIAPTAGAATVEKAPQPVSKYIAAAPAAVTDRTIVAKADKKKAKSDAKKKVKTDKAKTKTKAKS